MSIPHVTTQAHENPVAWASTWSHIHVNGGTRPTPGGRTGPAFVAANWCRHHGNWCENSRICKVKASTQSVFTTLCHMPKELNIILQRYSSAMFITALVAIARKWKQPNCPTTDEWMTKMGTYALWNIIYL